MINWVGQNLVISGATVEKEVDVDTNMGIKTSNEEFLTLENDAEALVMGAAYIYIYMAIQYFVGVEIGKYRHIWDKITESFGVHQR